MSARNGKAISKQTYAIVPKIKEVDDLLQNRTDLRKVVREVHPEVCFSELLGSPPPNAKSSAKGREERQIALRQVFPEYPEVEKLGRQQRLPVEDILDATVACWSANRLATGKGYSLPGTVPLDSTGLPMAIWV
jgi:predicted RNase H-like nuclease